MKITRDEVAHVARLARLEMAEAEMDEFTGTLNAILEYAGKLNRIDTKDILPTAHVLPLKNVFREDKTRPCLPREEALANAPEEEDGMFRVPRVIE
ncbi:MAG: Asp-tRNA(Asn)/Glu-tRNA(Gln) amidotransferase subunit GatC [Bacillota bacterium]|nr:Asp-tRNA(Asn)/Glu-tRNA(Gln) amidotransferase subunit GatC [Bacillota bacterium]MDW7682860.1 Asp-tRNA(Asn)/Glu-tRNA(Gln) amidotransferase subunit GatC [Bacillota bacterium]